MWLNQVAQAGRVASDLQIKTTNHGTQYASFRLALPRGGRRSSFITVECHGKHVTTALERARVGRTALVAGWLRQDEWRDQHGRQERHVIVVTDLHVFDKLLAVDPSIQPLPQLDSTPDASSQLDTRDAEAA